MALSRLRSRLLGLFVFWLVLLAALAAVTALRLQSLSATLDSLLQDRLLCQGLLRNVGDAYRVRIAAAVAGVADRRLAATAALAQIDAAQRLAAQDWQRYKATTLVAAEQRGIEQAGPLLLDADAAVDDARRLIAAADAAGIAAWRRERVPTAFEPLAAVLDRLFELQASVAEADVLRARAGQRNLLAATLLLVIAALTLGGAAAWALVVHYTAAVRRGEQALQRTNAFYTALSRTNQLIVRHADDTTLLRELCRICTETGHALATAVFRLDGREVTRLAAAGPAGDVGDGLPERWLLDTPAHRQSVTAIALSSGRHSIGRVVRHGSTGSVAAFPLRRGGRLFGALSLYAAEPGFFDPALVELLTEIASDVSFALDNLDSDAARVRLQQQTERDLLRFQKLFRASPMACVITSLADRRVLEINDVMCQRFELDRERIVGMPVRQLGSLLVDDDARVYREQLARDGRVGNLRSRIRLPDGLISIALINAETIDYNGQPCVMAMALDITELQATEAAERARAAAEAANREKTAFLSQMSHELRTPLNAMLGFTQLIQRDARTRLLAQDIEQLEHIRRAGWHLLSLVNDVMDVSRIEAGQFAINAAAVTLGPLLDEAVRLTEVAARASGIRMSTAHRRHETLAALADPLRLRQVLINLLSNAVKYNRPGGSVGIELRAAAEHVVVEVSDTGIGMSEQQLHHLYEPFNRLGRERGGIEGSGLGLALTRQLVGLMGGELTIESRLGVGTTARVSLPRAAPAAAGAAPDAAADAGEPRGTVLYIEDNEINAMVVEEMLSPWAGVRFVHAASGRAGIEQAARLQPDLVLMDMQLGDMDGLEILRQLRAGSSTAALHVVALSAGAAPQDIERALAGGAVDFWTKPLDLPCFLHGVSRHLAAASPASWRPR